MSTKFTLDELSINSFVEQMNIDEQINLKGGIDSSIMMTIANSFIGTGYEPVPGRVMNVGGCDYLIQYEGIVANDLSVTGDIPTVQLVGDNQMVFWNKYIYSVSAFTSTPAF